MTAKNSFVTPPASPKNNTSFATPTTSPSNRTEFLVAPGAPKKRSRDTNEADGIDTRSEEMIISSASFFKKRAKRELFPDRIVPITPCHYFDRKDRDPDTSSATPVPALVC